MRRTRILGYAHSDAPGSVWVPSAAPGDACDIFGPRASLDARDTTGVLAVFGDETSIALAYALAHQDPTRLAVCHFEVGDLESGRQVVARLALGEASLLAREDGDAHLDVTEAAIPLFIAGRASFLLIGRSGTNQRLRQTLKRHGVRAARILAKAYWRPERPSWIEAAGVFRISLPPCPFADRSPRRYGTRVGKGRLGLVSPSPFGNGSSGLCLHAQDPATNTGCLIGFPLFVGVVSSLRNAPVEHRPGVCHEYLYANP